MKLNLAIAIPSRYSTSALTKILGIYVLTPLSALFFLCFFSLTVLLKLGQDLKLNLAIDRNSLSIQFLVLLQLWGNGLRGE
ncbi:hypothetical protein [Allocoleopsis sp.]|uniref:hypothetical protein n=1 Tax=Allocoleopsis sp. TaxID=3088169 RepID=UPI002FD3BE7D